MTVTAGNDQYGAALDPQSRADLNKPQGLKSAPRMPNPAYPHLGFNPVPGDTEAVRGLEKKLSGCAKVLEEAHDLVTKLLDGSYWKGDAAVAFREQLDGGPLPLNLKNAAHSVRKAARQLDRWEGELTDFQRRAWKLEEDAREARCAVDRAQGRVEKLDGADGDAARKDLTRANGDLDDAEAELAAVISKAKRLAEEHEQQAALRARKIRDATKKLVPHEPGWFDEALDWLGDNLPDILSFTAGLVGVAALLLAGPMGWGAATLAALLLSASGLSAGALALRLMDPEVRGSILDGITNGELDADFWSNTVSVGADLAGVLPGVGAVAKGSIEALHATRTSASSLSFWQKAATCGSGSLEEAGRISRLENGLVARAVRGFGNPEKAAKVAAAVSGLTGTATGGYGLYEKAVDLESDGIKDGAVAAIDGSRLIIDNGGIIGLVRYVF
ncbi:putative T7SS-secreted protein [Streptomyces parvulus]|uniref:putative T7SS-secreted protein n=1 Tax=Streptomyces parvulus TaxID=146923 RepID=UPI0033299C15